jgi:hypothetical protein
MPILKPRLSRAEEAIYSDRLRELRAKGIPVETPKEWQEHSRALEIVLGGPAENTVWETSSGGVVIAVRARLTALRPVTLPDWDMSTAYDDQIVPEPFEERSSVYMLCGLQQSEVLNQRIENNLRMIRGQMVEGWFVATGLRPAPAKYGPLPVPFELVIYDQFGNENWADGRLSVLRSARQYIPGVRPGTLNGLDATQQPREPSIEEESNRRRLEMLAQDKIAKSRPPVERRAPMSEAEEVEELMRIVRWLRQSVAKSRSEEKKSTTGTQK